MSRPPLQPTHKIFPAFDRNVTGIFFTLGLALVLTACGHTPTPKASPQVAAKAADHAKRMVGTRYRYGGNHPGKGFDCSGLVHYSYQRAGKAVPRSTRLQYQASSRIDVDELRTGDLLFFNQLGKKSSHVGIYLGNQRFVHAPSSGKRVRIDAISQYWRRHLESARRF